MLTITRSDGLRACDIGCLRPAAEADTSDGGPTGFAARSCYCGWEMGCCFVQMYAFKRP